MSWPRPIPKRLFQAYALVLLAVAWGGSLTLAMTDLFPVPAMVARAGGPMTALVLWVAASLLWMVLVVPVRLFTSGFETYGEALSRLGADNLREAVAVERVRLERARSGPPAERHRRDLMLASGGLIVTLGLAVGVLLNLSLFPDRLFLFFPIGAVVSGGLTLFHGGRALLTTLRG